MLRRCLTKSRFQLAMQCQTKLFYAGKPEYANHSIEDAFLLSMAEGGFQVGALAKCCFPEGHDIETKDPEEALQSTKELMKHRDTIIYEGAFLYGNLFVRTDVLIKKGNRLELIEVKAKSYDSEKDSFLDKDGEIAGKWLEYLYDVAFQKYVLSRALPGYEIEANLMLADKRAPCPADGLNQMFRITKDERGRKSVRVSAALKPEHLVPPILIKVNADVCCSLIFESDMDFCDEQVSFAQYVEKIADCYERDEKIRSSPSRICKECEFQTSDEELKMGLKSGLRECWKESLGWKDENFEEQTVLDIWNFRKKDALIQDGRIKLTEVTEQDILPKGDRKPGLSQSQRQWLQVKKYQKDDSNQYVDIENLSREMQAWVYPLHFIDFETSMAAIPFNKGRHPYEGIAFQFSHHIVGEDGMVEHKGQYLNAQPGVFPNYDFVRALKSELDQDEGTIFRYAAHENSFLNTIRKQLLENPQVIPDRKVLCAFIEAITISVSGSPQMWEGPRSMVDMCELVKRYYYNPLTRGSNSIKYVLPAMLNSSVWLREKYAKPIYGSKDGMPSLNFKDWKWITFDSAGKVVDPYKLLPRMFQDLSDEENELLSEDDEIKNGGAALTAYARMQFEDMSDYERKEIHDALLKYCELDTLAMVMIYEGWRELIKRAK
jgi:hypothetical protein